MWYCCCLRESKKIINKDIDYFPDLRFSCNLVAARFLIFCSLLSALISDVLTILLLPDADELLLDELVDLLEAPLLLPDLWGNKVCCLLKLVIRLEELFTELGESDRLLLKVIGLSRLLLDFGRLAVFFIDLLHSEQKNTDRGSLTSASLMFGWWHSWWYRPWHSWHSTSWLPEVTSRPLE